MFYHVTFKSRLRSIRSGGITAGHRRNWNNLFGAKLGSNKLIYLFSDYTAAVRWAARMEWDFSKGDKVPEIVILRVNFEGEHTRDEHWENDGTWWTTTTPIDPSQIIDVIPLTLDMKKSIANGRRTNSPALP